MKRLSRAELQTALSATVAFFATLGVVANLIQVIQSLKDRHYSVILIATGIFACALVGAIAAAFNKKVKQGQPNKAKNHAGIKRDKLTALVVTCVVAVTLSLVALGVSSIYVAASSHETSLTSPSSSQSTTSSNPSLPTSEQPAATILVDNFEGPQLNPANWRTPLTPQRIYQANGSLNFQVGNPPSTGDVYTALDPRVSGSPITRIDFTVSVPEYKKAGQGGVRLVMNPKSPRPQRVLFGPSPNGPEVYALFCDRPLCKLGVYEDFTEGKYTSFAIGESVPITLSQEGGKLRFSVRGVTTAEMPSPPDPLTDFNFLISAGSDESWNISVDDLVAR